RLKGIVLAHGGTTSHTVILARAFGIPCITGVKDVHHRLRNGQDIILDAERGLVIPNPPDLVLAFYGSEISKMEAFRTRLAKFIKVPSATADGKRLEVGANIGSYEEAEAAFRNGAEGIGLFRTELLFMNRPEPPGEEEQFRVYANTATLAGKKSVIVRTLDIGGDKPIPYLNLPVEANPFLGYRAVRMYEAHKEIVETQLRAILRASAFGNLKIMIPMISSVEEVKHVRTWTRAVMDQLDRDHIPYNRKIEIGIMVEIPSACFIIDQLSREVDFFSIGSNDLTQYYLAVDRDNQKVAHLYSSFQPSFLRLMKKIIDDAHAHGKWVGLCGELGSNRLAVPLFIGWGIDEISLASPDIPVMKLAISLCRSAECRKLVPPILEKESPLDVETALREFFANKAEGALTAKEMIRLDSSSKTKEEAIRELVDLLHLADRVDDADKVEETIWQREATYSTGVGFGVAIPHCKSQNVLANSIAVLKLREPIDWGSADGQPVQLVILIAIKGEKAGVQHLKMIASLSRKLVDDTFRARITSETTEAKMLVLVNSALKS
ncbi:MAG TPA: phosphoenolpyruvate--protein phosphotransferase, partial [Bacteroidota bacterium]|nr:phosphoenolpyruvate--protein phosphotransferase [Bacteroidota bacterium]